MKGNISFCYDWREQMEIKTIAIMLDLLNPFIKFIEIMNFLSYCKIPFKRY